MRLVASAAWDNKIEKGVFFVGLVNVGYSRPLMKIFQSLLLMPVNLP